MPSIYTMLRQSQLRWAGHVTRMPEERLPKQIFYGELKNGARSQGGQKKRYKDTLKASLKSFDINLESWEELAQDRTAWRGMVRKGATLCETMRIKAAQKKREERKLRANSITITSLSTALSCPHCNRLFSAPIGLRSHLRTHPNPDPNQR